MAQVCHICHFPLALSPSGNLYYPNTFTSPKHTQHGGAIPEPPPQGKGTPVLARVIEDLEERNHLGYRKYGTVLRTHNGRNALWDAYQEILDAAMYLRQWLLEKEEQEEPCKKYHVYVLSSLLNPDSIWTGPTFIHPQWGVCVLLTNKEYAALKQIPPCADPPSPSTKSGSKR